MCACVIVVKVIGLGASDQVPPGAFGLIIGQDPLVALGLGADGISDLPIEHFASALERVLAETVLVGQGFQIVVAHWPFGQDTLEPLGALAGQGLGQFGLL
jgi:hypothetical protein